MKEQINQWAQKIKADIINMRRHLHQHPELSHQEYETAQFVKEKLKEYNIPFRSDIAKTGVLGIIEGDVDGGIVALRADMDALPINEENDHPFVSRSEERRVGKEWRVRRGDEQD